jgi:uncharacterized protein (DUF2267 family)
MATTGLEVFDKTLHTTNVWLDEISAEIGPDRHLAWHVLGAVLRSIRDEMLVEQSAHFAAQLPLLVRGAYFDQYRPSVQPLSARSHEDFIAHIQHDLDGTRPVNVEQAATVVMRTLNRHVTEGQIKKVRDSLPKGVRALWPEPEHKEPGHKEPGHTGAGQQKPGQSAKSDQGTKGAEPARSDGQSAPGGQRTPTQRPETQHAASQPSAAQPAEAPRPASQPAPQPAAPQHSASQQSLHRPAHDERQDIEAEEEETSSITRSSSGKSSHVPIGASGRPERIDAAPAAERTSTRKTKTGKKRTDD